MASLDHAGSPLDSPQEDLARAASLKRKPLRSRPVMAKTARVPKRIGCYMRKMESQSLQVVDCGLALCHLSGL